MKSSKLISLAIAMLFFKVVIAQERIITGIVTDGKYPVPGVFIKNGKIGTQTGCSTAEAPQRYLSLAKQQH